MRDVKSNWVLEGFSKVEKKRLKWMFRDQDRLEVRACPLGRSQLGWINACEWIQGGIKMCRTNGKKCVALVGYRHIIADGNCAEEDVVA